MSAFYLMILAVLVVTSILSFALLNRKPRHPAEMTDEDEYVDEDLTVTLINQQNLFNQQSITTEADFK